MTLRMITTTAAGSTWQCNVLPATSGLRVLQKLLSILGAPLGRVGAATPKSGESGVMSLDGATVGDALGLVTSRLDDPEVLDIVKLLLDGLHKDQKPVQFEQEFAANYGTLIALIGWALRENFQSFFDGNPWLGAVVNKAKASMSTLGTSTGDSGPS